MTKQEETKEKIKARYCAMCEQMSYCVTSCGAPESYLYWLHDNGVVLKVEGELPTFYTSKMPTCEKGLECSFVESLI